MKKIALVMAAALVTAASNANAIVPFKGFYVGGAVGVGNTSAVKLNKIANTTQSKYSLGDHTPIGDLHMGFSGMYKRMYLSLEANATFAHYSMTADNLASAGTFETLKNRLSYGAAIRNGVLMTPNTMAYITLGAQSSEWTFRNGAGFKKSHHKIHFNPGVGIETCVKKNMKVGLECTHMLKRDYKFRINEAAGTSRTFRPSTTSVKARVSFIW